MDWRAQPGLGPRVQVFDRVEGDATRLAEQGPSADHRQLGEPAMRAGETPPLAHVSRRRISSEGSPCNRERLEGCLGSVQGRLLVSRNRRISIHRAETGRLAGVKRHSLCAGRTTAITVEFRSWIEKF